MKRDTILKIAFILCVAFLVFMDIPRVEVSVTPQENAFAQDRYHYSIYENVTSISTPSGTIYKVYNPEDNTTIWYTRNLEQVEIMKGKI